MRLKLLFITIALFVGVGSWGQITIFSENFGTTSGIYPTGWSSSDATNGFAAVTTSASSGYSGSSGSVNARYQNTSTNGVVRTLTYSNNLSTVGYSSITVLWGARATAAFAQSVTFEWSINGTVWNTVSYTQVAANATWALVNGGTRITLPIGAEGVANLRFRFSITSNNTGNYQIDDFTVQGTLSGPYSIASGDWNTGSTWSIGSVPASTDNVTIKSGHTVTTNAAITRNSGTTTTVDSGAILEIKANQYTNSGATTINGSVQISSGGWTSGNNFTYGANANLIFNTSYGVNADPYWPSTNGPTNVTVYSYCPITMNIARTVSGTFQTYDQIINGNNLTLNGIAKINAGGSFLYSPIYGSASTLIYNTGGTYGRGYEWQALGVGTIGTTPGYPNNIQLSGNTTLNYNNGTPLAKAIAGNLTIDSGSSFYMDYGGGASGGELTVAGNLVSAGNMTLGTAIGDDLKIGGNITFNSGYTFDAKGRAVIFTKTGPQTIVASSKPTFSYVNLTSGTTTVQLSGTDLDITAPNTGNVISFSGAGDTFDINGRTLTLGTSGVANVINGSGTFKGSTTSNLTLLGTGSLGTLTFASNLNLGTLTMNRQAATVGCTMGSSVTINTALNLTNGLISLGNFDMSLGLTATHTGSANGFVISDPDVGTGKLYKKVNSLGAYTLHIGENTAPNGAQYAPATITFNSIVSFSPNAYYGVQVKDAIHPNIDSPTDYLTKYWLITSSGTFDTPVYSFTGTYTSGAADVNGTEINCISAKWDGTKWTNGVAIGGGTLTISGLTTMATSTTNEISAGNRNREINIKGLIGGTNNITSGSLTANGLNNTLFAATNLGSSSTKDYEIQNLGIAALNLTGTPIVSIGGANPGDFTVTTVPSSTAIVGGSSTSFIITFSPTYSGTRTAIISIANNDSDENLYTFLIQGTGDCPTTTNTITPTSGPVGTEVTINATANNLTGATVTFNGVAAPSITYVSSTQIKVIVPSGATSGNLITTNAIGCQATNAFTVIDNKANTCEGGSVASDLFISEVTDANTGGLSYIEIYNGTGSTINLSSYHIDFYSNGSTTQNGGSVVFSNLNLVSGSTYTVAVGVVGSPYTTTCSGQNDQFNGSLANKLSGIGGVNFNTGGGNDHIKLYNGVTQIDSWGEYENGYWANGLGIDTEGASFKRKNTVVVPNTAYSNNDWDITDWTSCSSNDYSDIGSYNFLSGTPPTVTLHPSYTPTCKATSLTVAGTEGYNGSSPADTKELAYKWLVSAPNATGWTEIIDDTNYSGSSTATLSIADISGVIDYQFYCQIRENTNTCYTASNAVKITDGGTTTWTTPGSWTNGIPTLDKLAIIDYDYNTTTNGDLNACSVKINDGFTLTVTAEKYATIRNDLTVNLTGKLEVLDKGSLVMINDSGTVTNTGTTNIHRQTSPFEPNDYTYWSTPIVSTNIETTFTNLPSFPTTWHTENAYEFNPANYVDADNDGFDDNHDDWSFVSSMTSGKGYIIMVPYKPFPSPLYTQATVVFSGKVNNGVVITPIDLTPAVVPAVADDDFNLVGNPYPSAISADAFINANISTNGTAHNTIEGTLYFWTHIKDLSSSNSGPDAYNYSQDDYAVYTLAGGTAAGSGGVKPLGFIASCQGFFVEAVNSGTLIFNNAMRVGLPSTANSQFYKSRTGKSKIVTKDRIWLNLENSLGMFSQQLVGYFDNTTLGFDNGYDGLLSDGGNYVNFYSFIDEDAYKIQGRSAFDENDQVRLGYFSAVAGTFNIDIDSKEGVFTNLDTAVYLEDKLLDIIYDLKQSPYTFTTEKGTFNDRFVLRYTNKTLSNKDFETLENQVLVSNKNKQIKVNSKVETIDKVSVYDLLGRQLFKKEKVNSNELTTLNLVSSQQIVLVKVSLQNGQTVTKKIIY